MKTQPVQARYLEQSIDSLLQELLPEVSSREQRARNGIVKERGENRIVNSNTSTFGKITSNSSTSRQLSSNQSSHATHRRIHQEEDSPIADVHTKQYIQNVNDGSESYTAPTSETAAHSGILHEIAQAITELNAAQRTLSLPNHNQKEGLSKFLEEDYLRSVGERRKNVTMDDETRSRRSTHSVLDQWAYHHEEDATNDSIHYEVLATRHPTDPNQKQAIQGRVNESRYEPQDVRNMPHPNSSRYLYYDQDRVLDGGESDSNDDPDAISEDLLAYFELRMREDGVTIPQISKRIERAQRRPRSASTHSRISQSDRASMRSATPTTGRSSMSFNSRTRGGVARKPVETEESLYSSFGNSSNLTKFYDEQRKKMKEANAPEYLKKSLNIPVRDAKKIKIVKKKSKSKKPKEEEDVLRGYNISTNTRSTTVGGKFSREDRSRHIFWKHWNSDAPAPNKYNISLADELTQQKRPASAFFGSEEKGRGIKAFFGRENTPGPQYNPKYSQIYPHSYEVTIKDTLPTVKRVIREKDIDYMRESFGRLSMSKSTRRSKGGRNHSRRDRYSDIDEILSSYGSTVADEDESDPDNDYYE